MTTTAQQAGEQPSDLQNLADKVVIANATGNEKLFLGAVRQLIDGVRALSAPHAPQSEHQQESSIHAGSGAIEADSSTRAAQAEPLTPAQVCAEFDALSARMNGWNTLGSVNAAWHAFKCGVAFALAARSSAGSSRGNHDR